MLLHSVIEEQHHISKRSVQLTGNHPGTRLVWALEVEKNHTDRLITLIRSVSKPTDLIVSVPESLSGFSSTRRDESYDSNSLSKAVTKTQSVHQSKGSSNLIFSSYNLVNETILPIEAFRAVRRMFFVPHSCHEPICIVSHPDFTSLFSHDTVPPSNREAVGNRLSEKMEQSLISDLRRIIVFKVQTSPKELSRYLEDMIKTSQNGQHQGLISFENDCSTKAETLNTSTDYSDVTKQNNKSRIQNNEGHTHLLQCIYGSNDGIFRWGIIKKKDSLDFKLTAESIEYSICHERQNRFERDGLSHTGGHFHPAVHVHSEGLNGVEGSAIERDLTSRRIDKCEVNLIETLHDKESCSLTNPDSDSIKNENKNENMDENEKESTTSIQQNTSRKYQGLASDSESFLLSHEENIQNKSVESVESLQKKVRTSESFKPASRAYYKMSEIKEFYFPLWNWTWPGDEQQEVKKEEEEGEGVGGRGVTEDNAEVAADERERGGGGDGRKGEVGTKKTREQGIEKCDRGIEYGRRSRNGNKNISRSNIQCCAIDVGSSPGGWTQCLAAHCAHVLSVDPGRYKAHTLTTYALLFLCCHRFLQYILTNSTFFSVLIVSLFI
jgi:hypothetical protein